MGQNLCIDSAVAAADDIDGIAGLDRIQGKGGACQDQLILLQPNSEQAQLIYDLAQGPERASWNSISCSFANRFSILKY